MSQYLIARAAGNQLRSVYNRQRVYLLAERAKGFEVPSLFTQLLYMTVSFFTISNV